MTPRLGLAVALVVSAAAMSVAQRAAPSLRFVSPPPEAFVSGPTRLAVAVDPPERVADVVRLVVTADGHEACTFTAPPFECDWDAGRDVVSHTLRAVAALAGGERVVRAARTRGLGYADRVDVDAVQLTVVVTDGSGKFVPALPRSAFRVFEDDRPQAVSTFAAENVPLELVAAIDVSQSMADAMDDTRRAARTFLTALAPSDHVTLLAFNDNIFTLARRATEPATRVRAVERLAPWGGTALYDVIIRGVDQLGKQPGRRALVLFSDGEDQSSKASMEAAVRRVEASDVTLYAIGLGRAMQVAALRELLDRLATISGGRGFFTDRSEELEGSFGEIVKDLSNQYLIGFQPTNQKRDGAWRRLRVEVDGNYRVRARQGYRLEAR